MLPDNRRMLEKRTQYLKRHLEREPKYFQHYKSFVDEIIIKGYAKRSEDTSKNGTAWYFFATWTLPSGRD